MTTGSLTLARGLSTLRLVATSRDGLSIQQVAYHVGVHRTVASRMLHTLNEFGLVIRGDDGRYRSPATLTVFDPADEEGQPWTSPSPTHSQSRKALRD
ncbi:helix-turn-helix domain-containing protein [Mycolicibacterium boenickei]